MKHPKPYPDVYLTVAADLGVSPEACAAIEDTDIGVESANAAGMLTVAYQNPTSGKQTYAAADAVVDDIRLLPPSLLLGLSK
jgi:beta-phosphoglucomutase-like phosphatase (HAD superfamily)